MIWLCIYKSCFSEYMKYEVVKQWKYSSKAETHRNVLEYSTQLLSSTDFCRALSFVSYSLCSLLWSIIFTFSSHHRVTLTSCVVGVRGRTDGGGAPADSGGGERSSKEGTPSDKEARQTALSWQLVSTARKHPEDRVFIPCIVSSRWALTAAEVGVCWWEAQCAPRPSS